VINADVKGKEDDAWRVILELLSNLVINCEIPTDIAAGRDTVVGNIYDVCVPSDADGDILVFCENVYDICGATGKSDCDGNIYDVCGATDVDGDALVWCKSFYDICACTGRDDCDCDGNIYDVCGITAPDEQDELSLC
jgi:hypothetical protein